MALPPSHIPGSEVEKVAMMHTLAENVQMCEETIPTIEARVSTST